MTHHSRQLGFTLIELVIVIMVLGILASLAMPKLQGIDTDAKLAATKGAKGALLSAAQITYGKNQGAVKLASVMDNTVLDDVKVTFTPTTTTGCNTNNTDTLMSAFYDGTFQISFYMDHTLCSG